MYIYIYIYQRHIKGVVSNGVVPKSQICKLVAKPAPDIQNAGHGLLIRPGLIRPGLCSPKAGRRDAGARIVSVDTVTISYNYL